ncbi:hypothetical protein CY35_16G056800 [Sphagnum magellanicum]|nr:hypothetical protein CY35_16G056800 [Sphagnum magellanicum]
MQVKHEKRKCHLFLTLKFTKISNWGSLHLLQKMPIHVCGTCKRSQCWKRFCSFESSQADPQPWRQLWGIFFFRLSVIVNKNMGIAGFFSTDNTKKLLASRSS